MQAFATVQTFKVYCNCTEVNHAALSLRRIFDKSSWIRMPVPVVQKLMEYQIIHPVNGLEVPWVSNVPFMFCKTHHS